MGGAEGDDFFAVKIEMLQKRIGRPGGDAPPDWIADDDCVVVGPVWDFGGGEFDIAEGFVGIFARGAGIVVGPV